MAKKRVQRKSTGNIHKASYAISALSWATFLQLTPYTVCYTVQPKCTNLPVVWISDDCVRKQKSWQGGERKEKKTNEENQRNGTNGIPMHSHAQIPTRESLNSQQHVLLVLLEDGADMLEDVGVKEVYTAVYDVTHKCARLFHIMQDLNKKNRDYIIGYDFKVKQ